MENTARPTHVAAKIVAAPLFVLFAHYGTFFVYSFFPDYDVLMHFLGGCAIAVSWTVVRRELGVREPWLYGVVTTVAMVALAAALWEFLEFIMDNIGWNFDGLNQPSLADTMLDLLMGILGGTIVAIFGAGVPKKSDTL